jgi:hypothetical protein
MKDIEFLFFHSNRLCYSSFKMKKIKEKQKDTIIKDLKSHNLMKKESSLKIQKYFNKQLTLIVKPIKLK